jgi:hypothetical protein
VIHAEKAREHATIADQLLARIKIKRRLGREMDAKDLRFGDPQAPGDRAGSVAVTAATQLVPADHVAGGSGETSGWRARPSRSG